MANSTWPSIQAPSYPLGENPEDAVIRSPYDAGYEQTRPRFTRNRTTYQLKWPAMSAADVATLRTFYITTLGNGAGIIDWTYPGTSTVKAVRFKEPYKAILITNGRYQVEATLQEV